MRIPVATYRLQFNRDFTLAQARELLPYLKELGISDVYASPLFLATPESSHGYDVCGYNQINPSVGTTEELEGLGAELRSAGMGLLIDIVPNHMGVHPSNCWWHDVLKHGEKSKYAHFFDINWNSPTPGLKGKVLLPLLGNHYANVLERGELKLKIDADSVQLAYFDQTFPLSPESEKKFGLRAATEEQRRSIVEQINTAFDDLDLLVQMQNYRLAYWRVGVHEINYRRFFDVTGLVSVRMEDEEVFRASHELIFDLVRSGIATGLRVDHPDGMRDPQKYFEDLQNGTDRKFYAVAEKILSRGENLPENWPVQGTTGYDYLNYLNGIFVRQENEAAFTEIYEQFVGRAEPYSEIAYQSKHDVLRTLFVPEVNALTRRLKRIASQTRFGVDFTEADFREALVDFTAAFPSYRNYVTDRSQNVSRLELQNIEQALREATRRTQLKEKRSLDFLARILSLECYGDFTEDLRAEARDFAVRFQQLSGPATAKGLEDTAFYRYNRFVSLNEVGGEPGQFGMSIEEFHEHNRHQCERWPHSLLATATHDTKRGEDVRARLNVLSEMPEEWRKSVRRWRDLNASAKSNGAPNLNDEYLLYQTLLGTWNAENDPAGYLKRIEEYMLKAIREAKSWTSWIDPNETYENGTVEFIRRIRESPQFIGELRALSEHIAFFGAFNSLAQVLLKICSPGVPDFYQGAELWDLSLVDPDNRRPVDYNFRKNMVANLAKKSPTDLLKEWKTGAVKLFTMVSALEARNKHREIFEGAYQPISATGDKKEHLIAFARTAKSGAIIAAVPRFVQTLTGGTVAYPAANVWGDTALQCCLGNGFRNLLTNEEHHSLHAADLFKTFPVALLLALG